jgi:hypothetical protein
MNKTLFDKIWDAHWVGQRQDGRQLLYIDRHIVHELHAPHAFADMDKHAHTVRRKDITVVVQDHTVPTRPGVIRISPHIQATLQAGLRHGVKVLDVNDTEHGIVHVVTPELGIALPGLTLACPDSHASTVGAIGCLAFGCGTTELVHVLSTQVMAMEKPRQMRIWLDGSLSNWVNAKDVALALIRRMGVSAARGTAVEYCGPVVEAMDIESRMTLCNMTIEWGGRTCLIAPDVCLDHHLAQLLKRRLGLPAQFFAGLGGIADQQLDFSRAVELGIDLDDGFVCFAIVADFALGMAFPHDFGIDRLGRHRDEVTDRFCTVGGQHVGIWLVSLQHAPHTLNVLLGKTPVALGVEVAQFQHVQLAQMDLG